jgi:hypothetical protein
MLSLESSDKRYVCCYIDCFRPRRYGEGDPRILVDVLIEFLMKWRDPRIQTILHITE